MQTQAEWIRTTSLAAYEEIRLSGTLGLMQDRVLYLICERPNSTDRELADRHTELWGGTDPNAVRPRRHELLEKGLIEEAGRRMCRVSGHLALTWRIRLDKEQPELF